MSSIEDVSTDKKETVLSRSKKLYIETNKRRRAAALRRKNEQDREEKRRLEILSKRRQNQMEATERYQRGNASYKYVEQPKRVPSPTPSIEDALRTVMARSGSPTLRTRPGRRSPISRSSHNQHMHASPTYNTHAPHLHPHHKVQRKQHPASASTGSHSGSQEHTGRQLQRHSSADTKHDFRVNRTPINAQSSYYKPIGTRSVLFFNKYSSSANRGGKDATRDQYNKPAASQIDPRLQSTNKKKGHKSVASSMRSLNNSRSLFEEQLIQQKQTSNDETIIELSPRSSTHSTLKFEKIPVRKDNDRSQSNRGLAGESVSSVDSVEPESDSDTITPEPPLTQPTERRLERPKAPMFESARPEHTVSPSKTEVFALNKMSSGNLQIRGLGVSNGTAMINGTERNWAPPQNSSVPQSPSKNISGNSSSLVQPVLPPPSSSSLTATKPALTPARPKPADVKTDKANKASAENSVEGAYCSVKVLDSSDKKTAVSPPATVESPTSKANSVTPQATAITKKTEQATPLVTHQTSNLSQNQHIATPSPAPRFSLASRTTITTPSHIIERSSSLAQPTTNKSEERSLPLTKPPASKPEASKQPQTSVASPIRISEPKLLVSPKIETPKSETPTPTPSPEPKSSTTPEVKGILKRISSTPSSMLPDDGDASQLGSQKKTKRKGIRWADIVYASSEEEVEEDITSQTESEDLPRPKPQLATDRPLSAQTPSPSRGNTAPLRRAPFVRQQRPDPPAQPQHCVVGFASSGGSPVFDRHPNAVGGEIYDSKTGAVRLQNPAETREQSASDIGAQLSQQLLDGSSIESPYVRTRIHGRIIPSAGKGHTLVNGSASSYTRQVAMLHQSRRQGRPVQTHTSGSPVPPVTDSLAAFQLAEEMISKGDMSQSQIEAAMTATHLQKHTKHAAHLLSTKGSTALSVEEQRLVASLERLNQKLQASEGHVKNGHTVRLFSASSPVLTKGSRSTGTRPISRLRSSR